MPALPAIAVSGLSKQFRIPHEQASTFKELALHPFRRTKIDTLQALQDVTFRIEPGEFFGVVGRNGSGKSTLLKCLAGIYRADSGEMYLNGRLSTFIELGVGFNPELAARDNVLINAVMLGLSPREARERTDEIVAFAELEDFVDLKLKNYSSGMFVRLAFSVMIAVDADVLLVDEVLAVGDASFQQKCFDQFERLRGEGRTVVLVTHDMGAVERACDRAVLLEGGRVSALGDPREIANAYARANFDRGAGQPGGRAASSVAHEGDGSAEITAAWFEDARGERMDVLPGGEPAAFAAEVRFARDVSDPLFGFVLQDERGNTLIAASSEDVASGDFSAGDGLTFRIRFDNVAAPGRYYATPAVARRGLGIAWLDRRERMTSVIVTGTRSTDAAVEIPVEVELQRSGSAAGGSGE